ncbi:MAG: hypothetical protein QY322_04890 [bacterium]|nr:MAG: hypothetical protein QY322_04890 [bacterium]
MSPDRKTKLETENRIFNPYNLEDVADLDSLSGEQVQKLKERATRMMRLNTKSAKKPIGHHKGILKP